MPDWVGHYLIPFGLGVVASMVGWALLQHALRPKISISPEISRMKTGSGDVRYRLKVVNQRKHRAAIDIEADAYIWIPGFYERRKATNAIIRVATSKPLAMSPGSSRLLSLRFDEARRRFEDAGSVFDDSSLETSLGNGELRMWIIATDSYSGYRRAFRATYASSSISEHLWKSGSSLELDRTQPS